MKHWNISLPRTPALALARQMLEGCLRTYDVPIELSLIHILTLPTTPYV